MNETVNKGQFTALMEKYGVLATQKANGIIDNNNAEYVSTLTALAQACSYSVLRKCYRVSGNDTVRRALDAQYTAIQYLDNLLMAMEAQAGISYNVKGDIELTYTVDGKTNASKKITLSQKRANENINKLTAQTVGDGADLIQDACLAILDETYKQIEREPNLPIDLERKYKTIRLKKRVVVIDNKTTAQMYINVELVPIGEVFRKIRKSIRNSASIHIDANNMYSYIIDEIVNPKNSDIDTMYIRLGKCADLGGYVTDYNGKLSVYTVDNTTVYKIDDYIKELMLTDKQTDVLTLRLRGYGYDSIANYYGCCKNAIVKTCKQIQKHLPNSPKLYDLAVKKGYITI